MKFRKNIVYFRYFSKSQLKLAQIIDFKQLLWYGKPPNDKENGKFQNNIV